MPPDEALANDDLIREKYRGIRPAPGYPACPDHSLKPMLFDMLGDDRGRRQPDREFRDAADLGGVGLLLRPSATASISAWRGSAATSSPNMPRGAASTWKPLLAGFDPTSTNPRPEILTGKCIWGEVEAKLGMQMLRFLLLAIAMTLPGR